MSELEDLDPKLIPFLSEYLPPFPEDVNSDREIPFILLTYAQSLDSRISMAKNTRTKISSLQTKTMTHYIRSKCQCILIGVRTFLADDPSLSCRFLLNHVMQPIILDPQFKSRQFLENLKLMQNFKMGNLKKPIIVVDSNIDLEKLQFNNQEVTFLHHGSVDISEDSRKFDLYSVFKHLKSEFQINSIMVEGGAKIINSLLLLKKEDSTPIVDSLIITIGPVFLGINGSEVSPSSNLKLKNINWWSNNEDSVIAARIE